MTRLRLFLFVLTALACAICAGRPARALGPRRFSLNLTRDHGAEDCITAGRMAHMVERLLGPVFSAPGEAELAAEVQLRVAPTGGFDAVLKLTDLAGQVLGQRALHTDARDCRELDRPLLLVIALAIDAELGQGRLPADLLAQFEDGRDPAAELREQLAAEPGVQPPHDVLDDAGERPPSRPPKPVREPPRAAAELPGPGSHWALRLNASAAVAGGQLPRWGAGAALGLEVEPPGIWPLRLAGAYFPAVAVPVNAAEAATPAVHIATAHYSLSTCPLRWPAGAVRAQGCAGIRLAHHFTTENSLEKPAQGAAAAWAPMLGAQLAYDVARRLALTLDIDAHVPLARDVFTYTETDERTHAVFRPPAFAASVYLGLQLHN